MLRGVAVRRARGRLALAVAASLAPAVAPGQASGQWSYGADVVARSRYEWRGLTRHDGWVLQPDVLVGYGGDRRLTAGALATVAISEPGDAGLDVSVFGEVSPWLEASALVGPLDVGAGWTGTFFDLDGARGPFALEDTHELYLRAAWIDLPLIVPRLSVARDIGALGSWYAETGLSLRVPVWNQVRLPLGSLIVTARSGWSLGVEEPARTVLQGEGFAADAAEDGLVHWGFDVRLPIGPLELGPVTGSLQVAWHADWKEDPSARLASTDGRERFRATWWELAVSVLGPRCRPETGFCGNR